MVEGAHPFPTTVSHEQSGDYGDNTSPHHRLTLSPLSDTEPSGVFLTTPATSRANRSHRTMGCKLSGWIRV